MTLIQYYVENMLPGILVAILLYGCVFRWRKHRLTTLRLESSRSREGLMLLFWMFCGGMAVLTLTPWGFHWIVWLRYGILSDQGTFFALGDVNLMPFRSVEVWNVYTVINFFGNILMFVPFGVVPALLWRNYTWRRIFVLGVCITGGVECWQLLVGRAFDVDDLLLNTLGVLCGYWLRRLLQNKDFYCKQVGSETQQCLL